MLWTARLRTLIRNLIQRDQLERDMHDELSFHIESYAADLERGGLPREEALRKARIEFGAVESKKDECRDSNGAGLLDSLFQDLAYGVRTMLRAPGFTIVAIVTLALGIGANAAIFSVVNAVLLRPLDYKNADRLVTILHDGSNPVAVANYIDWRDQAHSFSAMGAADYWSPNLTGGDIPEHLYGLKVTQSLLPMLGIEPLLGRVFAAGEDVKGSEHEVILSYGLWQRRFRGDPSVLNQSVTLDGEPYTIVGVMPRTFKFAPFWATRAELWVPNAFGDRVQNRGGNSLRVFARLKPGGTLEQARAEMANITARLEQQYPGSNRNVEVTPLKEKVVGNVKTPLLVLLAAVGFVLLIACANVAHMLLARATARQKELAVRTALGARRLRLIRQFLTENLVLAGAGAALGLVLAMVGTKALVALSPSDIPRVESVTVDAKVVLFLLMISALTSVIFGLAPAIRASAVDLADTLKQGGRGSNDGAHRNRMRSFLVASEFALALMLLVGAGLMVRSFMALQSVDPGFDPHHVLSMVVSVAGSKEAQGDRRGAFYRELLERVRGVPGVESAGGINHLPLAGDLWGWSFIIEGRPAAKPGENPNAVYRIVTPGYFESMKIPIIRGRGILESDMATAPGVVVINEQAAKKFWPNEDPIGKRISFTTTLSANGKAGEPNWLTVIGIAKNAKQGDWAERSYPETYIAAYQNREFMTDASSHVGYITVVVRTSGDPAALAATIKNVVWSFDRNLPISQITTMDAVVAEATAQPRFEMMLLAIFAMLALIMAAVGIYGVMSYSVSRRTQEIGIRISLGASRRDVLALVVREGMVVALIGSAAGLVGSLLLSRAIAKLLYGVLPTDPLTFGVVAGVLIAVALMAIYIPARRAMRVDPMIALRSE